MRHRTTRTRAIDKRRGLAIIAAVAIGVFIWQSPFQTNAHPAKATPDRKAKLGVPAKQLSVRASGLSLTLPAATRVRWTSLASGTLLRSAGRWLATHSEISTNRLSLTLAWSQAAARALSAAAGSSANIVRLTPRFKSLALHLPRVRQVYRNDCEAAALAMMLSGRVGQRTLQAALPIASPVGRTGSVWGDPQLGFVGDVRGGGYGVYERPLLRLARRYDPGASNLTGRPFKQLIAALRTARPIVAWVALGASTRVTWITPNNRTVIADFAEHTILLTGIDGTRLTYNDPWDGRRKTMAVAEFRSLWRRLGDRAIAGSSLL